MRRPERADSSTARVAIEGARGAAENIGRAGNAIAAVSAGWVSLAAGLLDAGCDVKLLREGLRRPWHGACHLRSMRDRWC